MIWNGLELPEAYYQDDAVYIIHGDCRDILPLIPDKSIDLVLTDPPYGIGLNHKNLASKRAFRSYDPNCRSIDWGNVIGDATPFDPTFLLHYHNIILWGANHYASRLPDSHFWFAWDRKCGVAADNDSTDMELAWVKGLNYKTVRVFRHMWCGFQRDSEVGEKHLHPTQKPVELFQWCLNWFPKAGYILDPFMGAGASIVAAKKLNRKCIGIEIEEKYCSIAAKRCSQSVMRLEC
uniref:Putative methyltransferase n=1 Tax=viral metagenome TaxID=1070528 RepID=A0A6M3IWB9_9ZZZZ